MLTAIVPWLHDSKLVNLLTPRSSAVQLHKQKKPRSGLVQRFNKRRSLAVSGAKSASLIDLLSAYSEQPFRVFYLRSF